MNNGERNDWAWLVFIALVLAGSIWVVFNPEYPIRPGLDLRGGLQVLLEADIPAGESVDPGDLATARQIIDQRVNGLGVSEPLVQVDGSRRILVELPGIKDPDAAINVVRQTALLEFIDTGSQPLPEGMCVRTTLNNGQPSPCESGAPSDVPPTFETVVTGADLREATAETDSFSISQVAFEMTDAGGDILGQFTAENVGKFLTIVLDKQVISSPRIQQPISDRGSISGNFSLEEAQHLALQLRYGRLPIPLRIESTREIGATLGQRSIDQSVQAGIIGVACVLLFMMAYYRLPGVLAALALLMYALVNLAVFELIGVTLTLPAIAGFLLSTGMAVDANILVFERMKEELRNGSKLNPAIRAGFSRAWTSIRDSNISTLVITLILWSFGRNFGASMVQGFAITLAIGVLISMFTAVIVTRTLVDLVMGHNARWLAGRRWALGV